MTVPQRRVIWARCAVALGMVAVTSCAGVNGRSTGTGGTGGSGGGADAAGGHGGHGGSGGGGGNPLPTDAGPPPITDFPPDPIFTGTSVPTNAPTLFGGTPRASGAPCIVAPEPGTLMPRNWLRPLFEYQRAADENLYEITLTVTGFAHPLVIYTDQPSYTLDGTIWQGLRLSVNDAPIAVSIRALTLSSTGTVQTPPSPAATSNFTIAPVDAPGKIVYWANPGGTTDGDGLLRGFGIGEESVEDVLIGTQVSAAARNTTQDSCIGCHSATPDGLAVGFVFGPPPSMIGLDTYNDTVVDIEQATLGGVPAYVNATALATIRSLRGIPSYSRAHWSTTEHIVLLTDAHEQGTLLSVDLGTAAPALTLARTNDTGGATEPTFSHDGLSVVYVSSPTSSIHDGRLATGPADLYTVSYSGGLGGNATPLTGAADPGFTEYYPAFSPDDKYVTFTRFSGSGVVYQGSVNPQAEVYVVSSAGGAAQRLKANDPPACTTARSPGVTNDWSKWSPEAMTANNGKTYYWLTFSSKRRNNTAQLFVVPIVTTEVDASFDFPALYLWNQPSTQNNHTPSWDDYQIPPVP
jgi:hypothetical protein